MPSKKKNTTTVATHTGKQDSGKRARSPEHGIPAGAKRSKNASSPPDACATREPNSEGQPPPIFSGNFDLYSHRLEFLSNVYLPQGTSEPQYEALYKKILSFQEKPDRTAQIYLASVGDSSSALYGLPYDPMEEAPLDDIALNSVELHNSLVLPKVQKSFTSSTPRPGVSASIALGGDHCGMQSLDGTLKMSRLWTKPMGGGNYVELFEGHITYKLLYSGLYRRKGHGSGQNDSWSFWAVRAKVGADGFEVGIQDGVTPVVVNSSVTIPRPVTLDLEGQGNDEDIQPVTAKKSASNSGVSDLKGRFKCYSMSGLTKRGLKVKPSPSYRTIYNYITENKIKPGLRCHINGTEHTSETPAPKDFEGHAYGSDVIDPFFNLPLHFDITSIQQKQSLSLTKKETQQFNTSLDLAGPGAIIQLKITDIYSIHRCTSIEDATGSIKLVRVWVKENDNGELLELYAAYLQWKLKITGGHRVKDSGAIGFWVVKANSEQDEEDELKEMVGSDDDEDGWSDFD